jgi:hypothetical protein
MAFYLQIDAYPDPDPVYHYEADFFGLLYFSITVALAGTLSPVLYIPRCLITVEPVRNLALPLFPGKERTLWQQMLDRPNFWVEGSLGLRPVPEAARQDK